MPDPTDQTDFGYFGLSPDAQSAKAAARAAALRDQGTVGLAAMLSGYAPAQQVGKLIQGQSEADTGRLDSTSKNVLGETLHAAQLKRQQELDDAHAQLAAANQERQNKIMGFQAQVEARKAADSSRHLDIEQQRADDAEKKAAKSAASGKALGVMEKYGKVGNVPDQIDDLYNMAGGFGRLSAAGNVLKGVLGKENPNNEWELRSNMLMQEVANMAHGSASESAAKALGESRPGPGASEASKKQWLHTLEGVSLENIQNANEIANNAGFPGGIVPPEKVQAAMQRHLSRQTQGPSLTGSALPMSTGSGQAAPVPSAGMVTVQIPGMQPGHIPAANLAAFKAKHPDAAVLP